MQPSSENAPSNRCATSKPPTESALTTAPAGLPKKHGESSYAVITSRKRCNGEPQDPQYTPVPSKIASAACSRSTSASMVPLYSASGSASVCHPPASVLPACSSKLALLPAEPRSEPFRSSSRDVMSHDKPEGVPTEKPPKKTVKKPPKKATKKSAPASVTKTEPPVLSFETSAKFARWLKAQPAPSVGVWLRLGKKAGTLKTLSYQEALDVALAWGWIDGQTKTHDQDSWLRRFTPRGPKSIWSKINRAKALALIEAGEMQPAGLAEVNRAQQDGRWEAAYDSPKNAVLPPDFSAALAKSPRAAKFFETLNGANRYSVLFRVQPLRYKKAETRARKIAELVAMLERGEKIHG